MVRWGQVWDMGFLCGGVRAMYKVIFFFSRAKQGWSESYYVAAGSVASALALGYTLAKERAKLLAEPAALEYIRVSSEANFRQSLLTPVGPATPYTLPATTWASNADKVETASLVRFANFSDGYERNTPLRGNPDNLFDNLDPANADAQKWIALFNSGFKATSANGNYSIKGRPRPQLGVNTFAITSIGTNPGVNSMSLVLEGNPVIGVNMFVDVYKVKGAKPTIGRQKVIGTTLAGGNRTLIIPYYTRPDFAYLGGGFVVVYIAIYKTIESTLYVRPVSRKTGRPFGVARGRQPVSR